MLNQEKFTDLFVFNNRSGEFIPPPETNKEEEAVPYFMEDGSTYWAILPKNSNAKMAFELFDAEGHFGRIRWIGWHLVPKDLRPASSSFEEGGDDEEWLKRY